jgi:hypothetical protein
MEPEDINEIAFRTMREATDHLGAAGGAGATGGL